MTPGPDEHAGRVEAPAPSAEGGEHGDTDLDAASVQRVVEAGERELQACYQSWLDLLVEQERLDPTSPPGGRVVLVFEILEDGSVGEIDVIEDDAGADGFERCLSREIASWRFPSPGSEAAPVVVEVPFYFEPRIE